MNAVTKHEPLLLPDPRRPDRTPSFPRWVELSIAAVRSEVQLTPDGSTFEREPVLTLPREMMPTPEQRRQMIDYVEEVRSLSSQTPMASEEFENRTAVAVSKLTVVLSGERKSDLAEDARAETYLEVLDDVPCWAVEAAARAWFRHEAGLDERGRPYDYRWSPDPGALRRIALQEAAKVRARATAMLRVIDAREFKDCMAEQERGAAAMRGMWRAFSEGRKNFSFEDAVKLGGR